MLDTDSHKWKITMAKCYISVPETVKSGSGPAIYNLTQTLKCPSKTVVPLACSG